MGQKVINTEIKKSMNIKLLGLEELSDKELGKVKGGIKIVIGDTVIFDSDMPRGKNGFQKRNLQNNILY